MLQDEEAFKTQPDEQWTDRSRTLIVMSKGVTAQQRRLALQLFSLLPHAKKEFKLEKSQVGGQIRQLCQLRRCRQFLYFESRKRTNFQLYAGLYPSGPTIRFQVEDFVGHDNLKFQGNCIKGSRHLLSFDGSFRVDSLAQSIRLVFALAFNVPHLHPKSKPCIDHVLAFNMLKEGVLTIRNYQVFREGRGKDLEVGELYEVGPRLVLRPMTVLEGAMAGKVLFRGERPAKPMRVWRAKHHRREGAEDSESSVSLDSHP